MACQLADPALVRRQGLEPRHCKLRACCSAIELAARVHEIRRDARSRTALLLVPGQAGHHFPFIPYCHDVELERFELSSTCLRGRCVPSYHHSPMAGGVPRAQVIVVLCSRNSAAPRPWPAGAAGSLPHRTPAWLVFPAVELRTIEHIKCTETRKPPVRMS